MDNKQPFYVGQRVVRIKESRIIPKGTIITVHRCYKCDKCGEWQIAVKEYIGSSIARIRLCECGANNYSLCPEPNFSGLAKYFAPIEPRHQEVEISESLKEQAEELIGTKETVSPLLEPVNN